MKVVYFLYLRGLKYTFRYLKKKNQFLLFLKEKKNVGQIILLSLAKKLQVSTTLAVCLVGTYFTSQMCNFGFQIFLYFFKVSSFFPLFSSIFLYFPLFWQKLNSSIFLETEHYSCIILM